jgi:excisionase family DNA binding protein
VSAIAPDGTVNLSPRECALLVFAESEIVGRWRRDGIDPPDLAVVLSVMREAAARARLARPAHRGVVVVPRVVASGSEGTQSVMTVRDAAERLKVSERAVVKAIHSGRLAGRRVGSGARWEITTESVDRYVPRRSNQVREAEFMSEAEMDAFKRDLLDALDRVERLEVAVRDLAEAS